MNEYNEFSIRFSKIFSLFVNTKTHPNSIFVGKKNHPCACQILYYTLSFLLVAYASGISIGRRKKINHKIPVKRKS